MSFVSPDFLIFFAVVVPLYFLTPGRFRWWLLLPASYFFYAYWNASYLVLIIFSTLIDYLAGLGIDRSAPEQKRRRTLFLSASILVNLETLFIFKYFNFFHDSIEALLVSVGVPYSAVPLEVLLPVGISFYTFQSMSYTIDVYRGNLRAEANFGIFATYVAFFPQLVAGPIERATNLLPQFRQHFSPDYARAVEGLRLILWGMFKKVVIADRLAIYVNTVYGQPEAHSSLALIVATLFFSFQIYCDFSGYSDIAIGTAKVMGFKLMTNFRQPFFSRSIGEFWRRWHISLSTWFRDYLYIPLGGSRHGLFRTLLNLMIVFVVSGLWHGASWTFVIWGGLHGLYVAVETFLAARKISLLPKFTPVWAALALKIGLTFFLVNIGWLFFRGTSLDHTMQMINRVISLTGEGAFFVTYSTGILTPEGEMLLSIFLIGLLLLVDLLDATRGLDNLLNRLPGMARWGLYYATALGVIFSIFLYVEGAQNFIYFQF